MIDMKSSLEKFKSFVPMIKACCALLQPKLVVEYGPGTSTQCFLDHSVADIYSWESHSSFCAQAQKRFEGSSRVHIELGDTRAGSGKKGVYVNAPYVKFGPKSVDVVFVDGRHRADCMVCASLIVKDKGVVILHDDERAVYEPGRKMFSCRFQDLSHIVGVYGHDFEVIQEIEKMYANVPKELGEYQDVQPV